MENKNILEAMLLLAKTLSYSQTYKQCLIDEIEVMIKSVTKQPLAFFCWGFILFS